MDIGSSVMIHQVSDFISPLPSRSPVATIQLQYVTKETFRQPTVPAEAKQFVSATEDLPDDEELHK